MKTKFTCVLALLVLAFAVSAFGGGGYDGLRIYQYKEIYKSYDNAMGTVDTHMNKWYIIPVASNKSTVVWYGYSIKSGKWYDVWPNWLITVQQLPDSKRNAIYSAWGMRLLLRSRGRSTRPS